MNANNTIYYFPNNILSIVVCTQNNRCNKIPKKNKRPKTTR